MGPGPGAYAWLNNKKSTSVPFRLFRNHVHIEAEINGAKKLELILDTGMPAPGVLLLGEEKVRELNLAYVGEARIGGAGGGSTPARIAAGVSLRIGDLQLTEQTAIVKEDDPSAAPAETKRAPKHSSSADLCRQNLAVQSIQDAQGIFLGDALETSDAPGVSA